MLKIFVWNLFLFFIMCPLIALISLSLLYATTAITFPKKSVFNISILILTNSNLFMTVVLSTLSLFS